MTMDYIIATSVDDLRCVDSRMQIECCANDDTRKIGERDREREWERGAVRETEF